MRIAEWNQMMSYLTDPRPRTGFSNGGLAERYNKIRSTVPRDFYEHTNAPKDSKYKISWKKSKAGTLPAEFQGTKFYERKVDANAAQKAKQKFILESREAKKKPPVPAKKDKFLVKVGSPTKDKNVITQKFQEVIGSKNVPSTYKKTGAVKNLYKAQIVVGDKTVLATDFGTKPDATTAVEKYRKANPIKNAPPDLETLDKQKAKRYLDKQERAANIKKRGGIDGGKFTGDLQMHKGHAGNIRGSQLITGDKLIYTPAKINQAMAGEGNINRFTDLDYKIDQAEKQTAKIKKSNMSSAKKKIELGKLDNKLVEYAGQSDGYKVVRLSDGTEYGGSFRKLQSIDPMDVFPGMTEKDIGKTINKYKNMTVTANTSPADVEMIKKVGIFNENLKNVEKAYLTKGVKLNSSLVPGIEKVFKGAAGIVDDWKRAKYLKVGLKGLGIVAAPIIAYDMYDNYMSGVPIMETLERSLIGTNFIDASKEYLSLDKDERLARSIVKQDETNERVGSDESFMQVDMMTPTIKSDMSVEEAKEKYQNAQDEYKKNKSAQEETIEAARRTNISNLVDLAKGKRFTEGAGDDFFRQTYDIGDIVKPQISYSKTGKNKLGNTPLTIDSEFLNMLVEIDLPVSDKLKLLGEYKRNKSRHQIDLQDQELFVGEGGDRARKVGLSWNEGGEGLSGYGKYNVDTGETEGGIKLLKRFEDGGRVSLKGGTPKDPQRRTFMKIAGGLAAIPLVGKYFKWGKNPAVREGIVSAIETVKRGVSGVPVYFNKLMQVIKSKGVDITDTHKTMPREKVTTYKNLELYEDGANYRVKKVSDEGPYGQKELEMDAKKDMEQNEFYNYDEATVRPDRDGKLKDVEMFIDEVDHLELEDISKELDFVDIPKKK